MVGDMETTQPATEIKKFTIGETYFCRSVCDHECVWHFEVTARTSSTVLIEGSGLPDKAAVRKIKVWDGEEFVMPLGSYSMAPSLRAGNVANALKV